MCQDCLGTSVCRKLDQLDCCLTLALTDLTDSFSESKPIPRDRVSQVL